MNASGPASVAAARFPFFDSNVAILALRYVLSLLAIGGNAFIILLACRFKRMRQSQCEIFILILALYDMFNGVSMLAKTVHATYALLSGRRAFQRRVCMAVNLGIGYCMYGQHIVVLAIAIDRLSIVISPLSYKSNIYHATAVLLAVEAIFTAFFLFCVFHGARLDGWARGCTMSIIAGPNISYIVLYGLTLFYYRRHRAAHANESVGERKRRRTTTGVMILLFKYFVLWTIPSSLIAAVPYTSSQSLLREVATAVDGMFGVLNSASTIFVYLLKNDELRYSVRRLLSRRPAGDLSMLHHTAVVISSATAKPCYGNRLSRNCADSFRRHPSRVYAWAENAYTT